MLKLLKYLKPYWYLAILAPLTMVGEVVADLFQPQLMRRIINDGITKGQIEVIWQSGLIMLGLVIIGGLCGFLSAVFASAASQKFANDLRKDCYDKVIHLSFEQTDKFTTGSLVTRITNDVTAIQQLVASSIRMFVRTIMLFLGGIFCMLLINPKFGYTLLVALPLELLLIFIFLRKVTPLFSQVQERLDDVNSVMQENVTGSRIVKAYVRENYESERFNKRNNALSATMLKVQKTMAFISPVLSFFMDAIIIATILIGGFEIRKSGSSMEVGDVMAALTYITQILMSLMMLAMMFQTISRARASAKRLNEVLETSPIVKSGDYKTNNCSGNITFSHVAFSYPSSPNRPVIKDISLKIEQGDTIAILGSTGCGKSSLVNLICRFYDVSDGAIYLDDVNIKEYELNNLRSNIAIILQTTELFTGTIEENIKWGNSKATFEEVKEACRIAQADKFIESFMDGYQTIIGEKGSSLSGGQKQRIAIARAILKKPAVLIFDDATSALDLITEANLYQALRKNLKDTTIIMIAQRIASVTGAKKIIVLERGKKVAEGNNEELLRTSAIYQDIYNSQLKGGVN